MEGIFQKEQGTCSSDSLIAILSTLRFRSSIGILRLRVVVLTRLYMMNRIVSNRN